MLKLIWGLFVVAILTFVTRIVSWNTGFDLDASEFFFIVSNLIPILMLITHSIFVLKIHRAIIFISIAMLVGFIFEYLGLNYGVVFGGTYIYGKATFMIVDMPIAVPFFWAVFIYLGYSMTNNLLLFNKRQKPMYSRDSFISIPILSTIDALAIVAIDLLLDPVQVALGNWTWLDNGAYFGIPIGNFWGWFIVGFIVSILFRTIEYYFPQKTDFTENKFIYLMPTIGFGLIAISLCIDNTISQRPEIIMIGLLATMPFVASNLLFYVLNGKQES